MCGSLVRALVTLTLLSPVACGDVTLASKGEACARDGACASGFCEGVGADATGGRCADPNADLDGDGLDAVTERAAGTDPTRRDTDGDGIDDPTEIGKNPANAIDSDGDGIPDAAEHNGQDADNDCLADHLDAVNGIPASKEALAAAFCQVGVCAGHAPRATCNGAIGDVTCEVIDVADYEPEGETRCDRKDNDCDGVTDEALDGKAGAVCGASGVCLDAPSSRCVGGQWVCNLSGIPGYETVETTCDGADNDCDGQTDEAPICDDGVSCTVDACVAGTGCLHTPSAKLCNDGNPCTIDLCELPKGCRSLSHIGTCDDGDPCTTGESCSGGQCLGGTATICDDGNSCTIDPCNPAKGCVAVALPEGTACKPSDGCQQAGTCIEGACKGHSAVVCDDGNPCTDDSCDAGVGDCAHVANTAQCNDGNPCTKDDSCLGKLCVGVPLPSCCTDDTDCSDGNACTDDSCGGGACTNSTLGPKGEPCEDNNPCTGPGACDQGVCAGGPFSTCDDDDGCTLDVCKVSGGKAICSHVSLPNGANCDDGDVCNGFGACLKGVCVVSGALVCDDGNPCTNDSCNSQLGCTHVPHLGACNDGNACTLGDGCASGACLGKALECDDLNVCTTDVCKVDTGCGYLPVPGPCDDGDACTSGDTCTEGTCTGGAADCDDKQPCTVDTCTSLGTCAHDATTTESTGCDDGDACTLGDTCKSGVCTAGVKIDCDDGNTCTDNACDPTSGLCKSALKKGSCVTATGCASDAVCTKGLCVGKAIAGCCAFNGDCNDFNPCTIDTCDKASGKCGHQAVSSLACSDGSLCTVGDACVGGRCQGAAYLGCDDNKPCTLDYCLAKSGCTHLVTVTGSCPDGDPCNGDERCGVGGCQPGVKPDCNDNNACTLDLCDPAKGCTNAWKPPGTACDDGSPCTTGDACDGKGACAGTAKVGPGCCVTAAQCDDSYACTTDACDGQTAQCVHTPLPCVPGGTCVAGWCETGTCKAASRCLAPQALGEGFEGTAPAGWHFTSEAPPVSQGVTWAAGATPQAPEGSRALHCELASGQFTASLPPMALSAGTWNVRLKARVDVDSADCSQGALQVLQGGQPLPGGKLCQSANTWTALDLPVTVTQDGGTLDLSLVFVGVAAKVDADRGAWVDDVQVVAAPAGQGCACTP